LLDKFEPVAPWVRGEETAYIGDAVIGFNEESMHDQFTAQLVERVHLECRMGFFGGPETTFDTDVDLMPAAFKPTAAAGF